MNHVLKKNNLAGRPGLWIFLSAFFLYTLTSPGNLPGDTEIRWSMARQLVRGNGVSIEDTLRTRNYATGIDGRQYSLWGLGQSLCLVPFAASGLILEKIFSLNTETSDLAVQFAASTLLFPAIGSVGVWLIYRITKLLGYSGRSAIFSSVVFGLATMHLHYSVCTQEQSQVAALLLLAVLLIFRNWQRPSLLYRWLFCVVLGASLLFRMASLVMVLPMYLIIAGAEILTTQKRLKGRVAGNWAVAGFLGTGGFVCLIAWYNYIRFGSIFETGYGLSTPTSLGGHSLFESSPLPTLAAMLFSPGKSIFLYNPILILLPVCIYGFYRKDKLLTITMGAAVIGNFILNSFHTTWAGDYAWSTRYQVPVLPFLVLPLAKLFGSNLKALTRRLVISLIMVSILVQAASVVYNFNLEFVQNPNHYLIPDEWVWDWSQSHLLKRFDNIGRHILNSRDFSSVKVMEEEPLLLKVNQTKQSVQSAYYVNFFPFKAAAMMGSKKVFCLLLGIWLVGLASFCISVFMLVRVYSAEDSEAAANKHL